MSYYHDNFRHCQNPMRNNKKRENNMSKIMNQILPT